MLRRFSVAVVAALALLVGAAVPALADDTTGHVHALVIYHTGDGWPIYVNGYCDVGFHPTGVAPFNVEAPADWTVDSVQVDGNVQEFVINHPYLSSNGYDFVDFDFTCTSD